MFKDTQGAGSWSHPTPIVVAKGQLKPKQKEPAGLAPGTWGNPEPLITSKKRPNASPAASASEDDATPTKRPKIIGKTKARKSVGGRRMMAALGLNRTPSDESAPLPTALRERSEPAATPSPPPSAPRWNTQPDRAEARRSREPQTAETSRTPPVGREPSEDPTGEDLGSFELPAIPGEPEGGFDAAPRISDDLAPNMSPASGPEVDILGDDDEGDSDQTAKPDRHLPGSVSLTSPEESTAAAQAAAADRAIPEGSISPPPAAQRSPRPAPHERTTQPSDIEVDELGSDEELEKTDEIILRPAPGPVKGDLSNTSDDGEVIRTPHDVGYESDDEAVTRPVVEVPPNDTETFINRVLHPERDIEVILGPDPPKEPSAIVPFGGQAVPVGSPRPVEHPPDHLRGRARREVGEEITEYNLTMRNLTSNPELQCEVYASYIGQATATDEPFAPEIRVVNKVDPIGKPPPFEFVYSNEMLYHEGVPDPELGQGCDCEGPCDPDSTTCSCVKRQELYFYGLQGLKGFAYDSEERVKNTGCAIWECSETCGCPPECLNRVISRGRKIPIELFKTVSSATNFIELIPGVQGLGRQGQDGHQARAVHRRVRGRDDPRRRVRVARRRVRKARPHLPLRPRRVAHQQPARGARVRRPAPAPAREGDAAPRTARRELGQDCARHVQRVLGRCVPHGQLHALHQPLVRPEPRHDPGLLPRLPPGAPVPRHGRAASDPRRRGAVHLVQRRACESTKLALYFLSLLAGGRAAELGDAARAADDAQAEQDERQGTLQPEETLGPRGPLPMVSCSVELKLTPSGAYNCDGKMFTGGGGNM